MSGVYQVRLDNECDEVSNFFNDLLNDSLLWEKGPRVAGLFTQVFVRRHRRVCDRCLKVSLRLEDCHA
jgi:hypothetical protein